MKHEEKLWDKLKVLLKVFDLKVLPTANKKNPCVVENAGVSMVLSSFSNQRLLN